MEVHTLIGVPFDEINRAATLADAIYVQDTTRLDQRVLYGEYSETPRVFSPDFLKARGAKPLSQDLRIWAATQARFGKEA